MKTRLISHRRLAAALFAATITFASVLLPAAGHASADTLRPYSLLYDPGPTNNCRSMVVEDPPDKNTTPNPLGTDLSGCEADQGDPTFSEDSRWDLGTWGWNTSDWGRWPGYSFTQGAMNDGTGSKKITMRNTATNNCSLHELNLNYSYSTELRPDPQEKTVSMADGDVNVSYKAQISQNGGFACPERRALLTTDFILQNNSTQGLGAGLPAVISVAQYDSGPITSTASPIIWETRDAKQGPCYDGCRIQVRSNQLLANSNQVQTSGSLNMAQISNNFSSLFQKYKTYVDPSGAPLSDFTLRAIQVVSSNSGTDTTAGVGDVQATLTPSVAPVGNIQTGMTRSNQCLDDFNANTQNDAALAIWPCTAGDNAEKFTFGWDSTLRVEGLCLDAYQGGTTPGTRVQLYTCNGGANQTFVVGRWWELYNPVSGLCLAIKNGASGDDYNAMDLEPCTGQPNEHWYTSG